MNFTRALLLPDLHNVWFFFAEKSNLLSFFDILIYSDLLFDDFKFMDAKLNRSWKSFFDETL